LILCECLLQWLLLQRAFFLDALRLRTIRLTIRKRTVYRVNGTLREYLRLENVC
jgi:hypothetical protein